MVCYTLGDDINTERMTSATTHQVSDERRPPAATDAAVTFSAF